MAGHTLWRDARLSPHRAVHAADVAAVHLGADLKRSKVPAWGGGARFCKGRWCVTATQAHGSGAWAGGCEVNAGARFMWERRVVPAAPPPGRAPVVARQRGGAVLGNGDDRAARRAGRGAPTRFRRLARYKQRHGSQLGHRSDGLHLRPATTVSAFAARMRAQQARCRVPALTARVSPEAHLSQSAGGAAGPPLAAAAAACAAGSAAGDSESIASTGCASAVSGCAASPAPGWLVGRECGAGVASAPACACGTLLLPMPPSILGVREARMCCSGDGFGAAYRGSPGRLQRAPGNAQVRRRNSEPARPRQARHAPAH